MSKYFSHLSLNLQQKNKNNERLVSFTFIIICLTGSTLNKNKVTIGIFIGKIKSVKGGDHLNLGLYLKLIYSRK